MLYWAVIARNSTLVLCPVEAEKQRQLIQVFDVLFIRSRRFKKRAPSCIARINLVPERDVRLVFFPAEVDDAVFEEAGKINQALLDTFAFYTEGAQNFEVCFDRLSGFAKAFFVEE